ncbi:MAG TPA: hypothetical protein VHZ24_02240 [Pirellulales bacterium]|jgi:hypothetical protein|nr:hypothetical protein [Pirellulales bacterium]
MCPPPGAEVGRTKIAENTSPMPRDRVYLGYSYFNGVPLTPGGTNVNRYSPGFEKTFFDRWASFELRMPMASSIGNNIITDGSTATGQTQFGNMVTTLKTLLIQNQNRFALSSGLALQLPTGANTNVYDPSGNLLVKVDQRAVHFLPFLGFLYTPSDRFFLQGFSQIDIDSHGARVQMVDALGNLTTLDRVRDQNLMYTDIGCGYWIRQRRDEYGNRTGIAPIFEFHWNKGLNSANTVQAGSVAVGTAGGGLDDMNLTLGCNFAIRRGTWAAKGCDNQDILSHCRSEGPPVRGCWVVDLVLGKE